MDRFALWPGCYHTNLFTEIVNSANIAEALANLLSTTTATSIACEISTNTVNNKYKETYFNEKEDYINERQNGKRIHPFSTSNSNTTTVKSSKSKSSESSSSKSNNSESKSYIPFSLEFYEAIRKGIEKMNNHAFKSHWVPISTPSHWVV